MRTRLEAIGGELGVDVTGARGDRLLELVRLWRAYAPAINLLGAHDDDALVAHVADGLATVACAARVVPLGPEVGWLDVGSGAGLPGLVIAATTECRLVLAEPRLRRAAFLELALATIGRQAAVLRVRIGDPTWGRNRNERNEMPGDSAIVVATARAVMEPEAWLALGEKLVMDGGVVIAHLRPGRVIQGSPIPAAEVVHRQSKIQAFSTPIRHCST